MTAPVFRDRLSISRKRQYQLLTEKANYFRLLGTSIGVAFVVATAATILAFPVGYFLAFKAGSRAGVYLALLLMVLALVKRFPYHLFQKTHKWLAAAYLALVYHAIVLVNVDYWNQPVGWVLASLLAGGSYAAVLTLLYGLIESLLVHRFAERLRASARLSSLLRKLASVFLIGFGVKLVTSH